MLQVNLCKALVWQNLHLGNVMMSESFNSSPSESNVDDLRLQRAFQLQEKELRLHGLNRRKQSLSSEELHTKYEQRQECARQILALCRYFDAISPAVFASSVGIMDSALIRVHIPWKYLSCFSAACFIIGSKWIEDELEPSLSVLTELHSKQWKEVDLRRMEEKILQVLGWEVPQCTYLTFLPVMTHLLISSSSSSSSLLLPSGGQAIRNAELLLQREFSFVFKPAAVALGALEHAFRHHTDPALSLTVVALQDYVRVLDSELHEITQILNIDNSNQQTIHKGNKAYFPKVFEMPYDSFCPDYRLHTIPEEGSDSESGLRPAVCPLSSPHGSISDYDYSDDEEEDSIRGTIENSRVDGCERFPSCTVFRDSIDIQHTCPLTEFEPRLRCADDGELGQEVMTGCEQPVPEQDSSSVEEITKHSSSTKHGNGGLPVVAPDSDMYVSDEDDSHDSDSGCEQDSDEQDSCGEHDCSEQDFCSEHDSSEQDSGCDQDSDFHDSSPCRPCPVRSCSDEVQRQALTFD